MFVWLPSGYFPVVKVVVGIVAVVFSFLNKKEKKREELV